MSKKNIVVSGMRPTGRLHFGNYWGALKNWLKLQDEYKCFFFVADWHDLTTGYDSTGEIRGDSREMVLDWLTAGLDPEKCCIFEQSKVTEHAELALLLGMITPVNWLSSNPTYKEQLHELYCRKYAGQEKSKEDADRSELSTYGFLGYPVLQAADILIYRGKYVPVGQDQLPHLELARDIARRFSEFYGNGVLTEPQPLLTSIPKVPGIDGRKMSKSYGNAIEIGEDLKSMEGKVMRMYTDPTKIKANDKGHPPGCVVYAFHKLYNPGHAKRENECKNGEVGCVACKKELCRFLSGPINEFSRRRTEYEKNPARVDAILKKGNADAKKIAAQTMETVRRAMKLRE